MTPAAARRFGSYLGVTGLAFVMLYPLLWMFSASLAPGGLIGSAGLVPPNGVTFENYTEGWKGIGGVPFSRFFLNSLTVSTLAVIGNLLSCSLAAYAFARIDFKLRGFWFALALGSILLPAQVLIIPQYILFRSFGWINTYFPLIVPRFLAHDAFFVFLMVQFIRGIPRELDQAARIDGCGHFGIYARIIMPLALPALATTAAFTFITTWNDFFGPLIYLTRPQMFTVPIALRAFIDATSASSLGPLFAMSFLSLLPVLGFFIAFQRLLTEGIVSTGFK
jgi:pectin-derived oligosaccharide transport system permease protein